MGVDACVILGYGFLVENTCLDKLLKDLSPDKMLYIGDYVQDTTDDEISVKSDGYSNNNYLFVCVESSVIELIYTKTGGKGGFGEMINKNLSVKTPSDNNCDQLEIIKNLFEKYDLDCSDTGVYTYFFFN